MATTPEIPAEQMEPEELAESVGLVYVADTEPGITRRRAGRGFAYQYASGRYVKSKRIRKRIEDLAIPPAWEDVWICRSRRGHLQATGRDDRNRKQYLYHERWQEASRIANFRRLAAIGRELPRIRKKLAADLRAEGLHRDRVLAGMTLLLDASAIRIGNEAYTDANGSHGLSTLHRRHVELDQDAVHVRFRGKSGKQREVSVCDPELAKFVQEFLQLAKTADSNRLFVYREGREWREVSAELLNAYLQDISRLRLTAKDFRTWKATAHVAGCLWEARSLEGMRKRRRALLEAVDEAADRLGNTRAVCRDHYVHPGLLKAFRDGTFGEMVADLNPRRSKYWDREERVALHVLEQLEQRTSRQMASNSAA